MALCKKHAGTKLDLFYSRVLEIQCCLFYVYGIFSNNLWQSSAKANSEPGQTQLNRVCFFNFFYVFLASKGSNYSELIDKLSLDNHFSIRMVFFAVCIQKRMFIFSDRFASTYIYFTLQSSRRTVVPNYLDLWLFYQLTFMCDLDLQPT